MDVIKKDDLTVHQIKTGCLAQFAYLLVSNMEVIVIDPLRDVQVYVDWVKQKVSPEAKITYVALTHYHADFVSGYIDLAHKTGATILFGPDAHPTFEAKVAKDGEEVSLGVNYKVKVLHTPGHTLESSCFLVTNKDGPVCVLTGDTLFLGDVGRPDLAQKGTLTSKGLAAMLYKSLKKLTELPDSTIVLPGHGAGSACGKNISSGTSCDIGTQKKTNYALQISNEEDFCKTIASGLDIPPEYFAHNVAMNKAEKLEQVENLLGKCKEMTVAEFKEAMKDENTYVIDSRDKGFKEGHIPGSLFIPTKQGKFAIWAANVIKPNDKILLVGHEDHHDEAVTRLARTGLDKVIGYLKGGFDAWKKAEPKSIETVKDIEYSSADDFMKKTEGFNYCDVRGLGEWKNKKVIDHENTKLLSLHLIRTFIDQNPDFIKKLAPQGKLAVNCLGGTRSVLAWSLLKRRGMSEVYNINRGWRGVEKVGVKLGEPKESMMLMSGYD